MAKKIIDRKQIMGAVQGAVWMGLGYYVTDRGTHYLNTKVNALGAFSSRGPWHQAAVRAGTGLLATGLVGTLLSRKNAAAGKKAGAYLAAGAVFAALYPPVATALSGLMTPGGRRSPTITQALPSASAAPSTAMLRAGGRRAHGRPGGIVMGAPAVDADAAAYSMGRPGGRYINPRFQWSNIREL